MLKNKQLFYLLIPPPPKKTKKIKESQLKSIPHYITNKYLRMLENALLIQNICSRIPRENNAKR